MNDADTWSSRHTCARVADHGLPGGWLTLEDLLGHIGDACHLATSGPQLSLKLQVVCDRQRLGLFLVVKIAAATAFQRWGDRRVDGGPGSLIRGLQGEEEQKSIFRAETRGSPCSQTLWVRHSTSDLLPWTQTQSQPDRVGQPSLHGCRKVHPSGLYFHTGLIPFNRCI